MKPETAIVGRLCYDLYPETKNELEAIEAKIISVERDIDFKVVNDISSSEDIEFHSALQICRAEYINEGKVFAG